ncbi:MULTISPECIES: hypothetical protein [unclassified Streptomyces]|uniref:DUF6197 family protein n=1 Tax=unclassified Streptomyces TaxID=2593676 RepID=UPI001660DB43|nr:MULTISPECIES: hypothetical protein [unclassified Streptomyces]MBD0708295.1 hypothetical protein [Streptomyces sp. CBMA291]MBD0712651.1 hypothetical protein [Streptomyces sp. CBMA370]
MSLTAPPLDPGSPLSPPPLATAPPPGPDALDREAAALYESAVWQRIVTEWATAPALAPDRIPAPDPEGWRRLLTVPVDRLVADALDALPPPPPVERRLPGRIGAVLPDRLHVWRRIGRQELRPSVHLGYARLVLTEWGWQNTPYKLRDLRGARCVCGALLAAHRLGYGGAETMNEAAAWIMTELRSRGWHDLIGPWNRAPGRTAADAVALIDATIHRAAHAGR